jgi:CheY-like chemotaxis protein
MLDLTNPKAWSILLVDDEPDNVEVVAESLTFFGVHVQTATDGEQGLEVLKGFSPDIILLDLSMPKMDGWVMRQKVKADPATAHIPVIALSAHAMVGDKERALEVGFDGYLTKPVNIATLLDDIREALQETKRDSTPERSEK